MQYTIIKINTALKKLEKVKEIKKHQDKLYIQYEQSLLQTKLALKPVFSKFDLKKEFDEMKKVIQKELDKIGENLPSYISNNPSTISNKARLRLIKKYNAFISMPDGLNTKWDDFVFYVVKTHDKVRKKLIKNGSILT